MKWALVSLRATLAVLIGIALWQIAPPLLRALPPEWNPTAPFEVAHPLTPLTEWKLAKVLADPAQCKSALAASGAAFRDLPDFEHSPQCHIRARVGLEGAGRATLAPVETTCSIALRLAMWERHSLQPAAKDILGAAITGIDHFSSYNCRAIRSVAGPSSRMSTHATASAIDVSGFRLADGRRLTLLADWQGAGPKAAFLRAAQTGACKHFGLVLGPEYNRLHADHFHIQSHGNGCR